MSDFAFSALAQAAPDPRSAWLPIVLLIIIGLVNLYSAWRKDLVSILKRLGLKSVAELTGRSDLLMHLDYTNDVEH